jgi:hypothetical protein
MWVEVTESDLASTIAQSEIDAFRADGPLAGTDPVVMLLKRTVSTVRGFISCNGGVRMEPSGIMLPEGLVLPAMDYAAAKLLKRINVPLSEDRREALRKAEELFDKIATGAITPESWTPSGATDSLSRPATAPSFAPPSPERLLD